MTYTFLPRSLHVIVLCVTLTACATSASQAGRSSRFDIPLKMLDGTERRLSDMRGENTLLHFWATWCATCREELSSLNRIATDVPEVAVVAVAVEDDPTAVEDFLEKEQISFPVVLDQGGARETFSISALPFTVFLDAGGTPQPFLDPASGESVSAIPEARYWGSSLAVKRIGASARQ